MAARSRLETRDSRITHAKPCHCDRKRHCYRRRLGALEKLIAYNKRLLTLELALECLWRVSLQPAALSGQLSDNDTQRE